MSRQALLWCRRCGREGKLKRGLCLACYSREIRNQRYFAGLRLRVIARDRRACRVCGRPGSRNRIHVHHRRSGVSQERFLITLCPGHHAIVHRLRVVRRILPALVLELWANSTPALASSWRSILTALATPAIFTSANYGRFRLSETALIRAEATSPEEELTALVLNGVTSPNTQRAYQTGLEQFFGWRGYSLDSLFRRR